MSKSKLEQSLSQILEGYQNSFLTKIYPEENDETDVLMKAFGITQELKSENKQYWGRELGKCWESLVKKTFSLKCRDFSPPLKFGNDEPADFFVGGDAIDTKYRVGSGDSGTLKKFESYGKLLLEKGYRPVFLFLRTDNLPSAISKCLAGGWLILMGDDTFKYIEDKTGFDLKKWLKKQEQPGTFKIYR